jgi:hypothetical protein
MKTVQAIVDAFGGMDRLAGRPITVTVPGFMPLSIEAIGTGPRGGVLVSVMHTYEQNGDLMRDPDLVLEVLVTLGWWPVRFRQDNLGIDQTAVWRDGDRVLTRGRLVRDLRAFMRQWDRNLAAQGFLDAARIIAGTHSEWTGKGPTGPG